MMCDGTSPRPRTSHPSTKKDKRASPTKSSSSQRTTRHAPSREANVAPSMRALRSATVPWPFWDMHDSCFKHRPCDNDHPCDVCKDFTPTQTKAIKNDMSEFKACETRKSLSSSGASLHDAITKTASDPSPGLSTSRSRHKSRLLQ